MVLGQLPVPGHPTYLDKVGPGPITLAVGAVGFLWTFFSRLPFVYSFSLSPGDGLI